MTRRRQVLLLFAAAGAAALAAWWAREGRPVEEPGSADAPRGRPGPDEGPSLAARGLHEDPGGGLPGGGVDRAMEDAPTEFGVVRVTVSFPEGDPAGGRRATVVVRASGWRTLRGETGTDGHVEIRDVPAGPCRVEAAAEGPLFAWSTEECAAGTTTAVDLGLVTAWAIQGRVLDGDGRPIAGARVVLVDGYHGFRDWTEGRAGPAAGPTGPDGRFELVWGPRGPKDWGGDYLATEAPGYASVVAIVDTPGVGLPGAPMDIRLERGARAVGRVVGPEGAPAAGALVRIVPQHDYGARRDFGRSWLQGSRDSLLLAARTDAAGRYRIDGLRTDVLYAATVRARGSVPEADVEDLLATDGNREVRADLRLVAPGALRVAVRSESGVPAAGAMVELDGVSPASAPDAQGIVQFPHLPPGTHVLRMEMPEHAVEVACVEVTAGRTVERVWEPDPGEAVEGTVVDAEGSPIPQAYVLARQTPVVPAACGAGAGRPQGDLAARLRSVWPLERWALTDDHGAFRIRGLARGSVEVLSPSTRRAFMGARTTVSAPATGLKLRMPASAPAESRLVGAVRFTLSPPEGRDAPPGVAVRDRTSGEVLGTCVPDAHGACEVTIEAGRRATRLTFQAGGYAGCDRDLDVPAGGVADLGRIALEPAGDLVGTVRDRHGTALPHVEVLLLDEHEEVLGSATTDAEGRFRAAPPLPGWVLLSVRIGDGPESRKGYAIVRDGAPADLVALRGATLRGRVVDARGRGVGGRPVWAVPGAGTDPRQQASAGTDVRGAYSMRVLPGRYELAVQVEGRARRVKRLEVLDEGEYVEDLTVPDP